MHFTAFHTWMPTSPGFVPVIAGPCAAESFDQILATAFRLAEVPRVGTFRAGVWKPRTRPGGFEGVGKPALKWLCKAREKTGLKLIVEVATRQHVRDCLDAGIDMLWVGARTCANPFSVQEIADELAGQDIPVFVKNPLFPDNNLWAGAIERFQKAGISKLAGILRGVYPFEPCIYRNMPKWEMAIELKLRFPTLPVLCDPSHMAGDADLVQDLCQKSLDLNMDGLMIESHISPATALSDARQQLTPSKLGELLGNMIPKSETSCDHRFVKTIQSLRLSIDDIDRQLLGLLRKRAELVQHIGREKISQNISILQMQRWEKIQCTRREMARAQGLNQDFIIKLFNTIHEESIEIQRRLKRTEDKASRCMPAEDPSPKETEK